MYFNDITTLNLVVSSFIKVKNEQEKSLAAYILCLSCNSIFFRTFISREN